MLTEANGSAEGFAHHITMVILTTTDELAPMARLISGTEEEVTGRSWDWSHPPPLKCQGIAINEEQCGAMTEEQCGAMTNTGEAFQ